MKISKALLEKAVNAKIITEHQADQLIAFIKAQPHQALNFDLTNVLYYLGGLVAIGAMTLFMNLGWERYGGWGLFSLSMGYAFIGLYLTGRFHKKSQFIPAGICATFVIALTPLAIYGIQKGMGWWPDDTAFRYYNYYIKWHWMYMEIGTLIVGITLAWYYRYPFMIMPIAVTLWYMSVDIAAMIFGGKAPFELRTLVSMYFGLIIILITFFVDMRSRKTHDYAFWLYIFGVIAFWGGVTSQSSDGELTKFIYLCINLAMIFIGVVLNRKVFVIFGGIGCSIYLGHLAANVFKDSMLFPASLTLIGLIIIYLGVLWQKYEHAVTKKMRGYMPKPLQELLISRHE